MRVLSTSTVGDSYQMRVLSTSYGDYQSTSTVGDSYQMRVLSTSTGDSYQMRV